MHDAATLAAWVEDARRRTFDLVADLDDGQLLGPRLAIVNPLRWEIGHVAWFQERWVLRTALGRAPLRADADALYDSSAVPHDTRWDLPLPDRAATVRYLEETRDRVLEVLAAGEPSDEVRYFVLLATFHEDMHDEAFLYTRQTYGWPAPPFVVEDEDEADGEGEGARGDAHLPGGRFLLGATPDEPFVFDNEKWAHPVEVRPFAMARAPVTQAEFAAFVDAGGYRRRAFWSDAGWAWRERAGAEHPVYWRREAPGRWLRRAFDRWRPLEPRRPVLHVNWYEADAFCRFAGRRLPTEVEWEVAATTAPDGEALAPRKRRFPWGDGAPTPAQAHLDGLGAGCRSIGALPAGDNPWGCRQLIGNVWEWCADDFLPYPAFVPDPYRDYSQPWFRTHKVLRGGAFPTRARLLRGTWRNFYTPDRRDVWCGFRTCAP